MRKVIFFILLLLPVLFIACNVETSNESVVKKTKYPEWSKNVSIYEVNIRQYSQEGTFNAFANDLERVKELGVGIIWLMPIHPIGEQNRKGTLGSYYAVKDYKKANPEFGSLDDFKNLVDKAHQLDLKVIIDWVANHTAWDNVWTKEHPDFYSKDASGNFMPPVKDWSDVIDLNYDNKELWDAMTDAMSYWVKECDIDGFRCDVAGMVPTEFWNYARNELNKVKPVFMLAEDENPGIHSAFEMTYSWSSHHLMNEIAQGKKSALDFEKFWKEETGKFDKENYRMYFTSNHDENSWNGTVFERMHDAAETFAVLSYVMPGMPLIYNGQEAELNKRLKFFEKDPIHWKESKFFDLYKKLNVFKKDFSPLWNGSYGGNFERIYSNNDSKFLVIKREKEGKSLLAVFNLTSTEGEIKISDNSLNGEYTDLFTGTKTTIINEFSQKLSPWSYLLLYTQ